MRFLRVVLAFFLLGTLSSTFVPALAADPSGPPIRLKAGSFDPLRERLPLPDRLRHAEEPASGIFAVQFSETIRPALLDRVRSLGGEPIEYLPERAFLFRLPAGSVAAVRSLPGVRWAGAVEPGWKIAPDLGLRPYADPTRREGGVLRVTIDLWPGEDPEVAARAVAATGADVLQVVRFAQTSRLRVHATREEIDASARLGAVAWIEEMAEITPRNNTTRWVIQSDIPGFTPVWDAGLHGEGQVIGHIDGRIDMNSCFFRDATNNTPGPGHRKVVAYRSSTGLGADSHGTHTAGTSAGDQFPLNGTLDHAGNAYAAKLSHSNLNDIDGSGTSPSNLYDYLAAAHADGARMHTNSWGDDGTTAYTTWTRDIDRFSHDFEESLVFFAVTNTSTLKTPENAKNVVAVGASGNGTSDDTFCSGGRGPTNDGRRKPEIFAPGCSIVSAGSGSSCGTRTLTGTSMACPAVTAAGALVRQYFLEGRYPEGTSGSGDPVSPTGALVKAVLLNGAVDMTGISGYPSNQEGWGRVLLDQALPFPGDVRTLSVLDDLRNSEGLSTGQTATYELVVEGSDEPLRITAVWTEPPASLLANPATVNDLDLEVVSPTGDTYLGNVVDSATGLSTTGGSSDSKNNVEQVIVASPAAGTWIVRMKGTAVNQGTQGFAVVASGRVEPAGAGALRYAGHRVEDPPPGGNGDGAADPGETVTIPVDLRNASAETLTAIAAALRSGVPDLVRVTDERADWADLGAEATGTSLVPHFRATLSPDLSCGSRIPFSLESTSSAGESGASFVVDVGKNTTTASASGLPLTIPKNSSTGVTSQIQVAESFTVRNVTVDVDLAHGNVGELTVQLRSPTNTVVTLHAKSRAGEANLVANYDLDRPPDGPGTMNDFDGKAAQGTWSLLVVDDVSGATPPGSVRAWTLRFEATSPISCSPRACAEPVPGTVGTTLSVRADQGDVVLEWGAVPGAAEYRIWRATVPDFSDETLAGVAPGTSFVDAGTAAADGAAYYRVRAVNVCGWEGP
jgi:subtilisin-like proprotein convertase family protein